MEKLTKANIKDLPAKHPEGELKKRFNSSKFIKEGKNGGDNLTGAEKEADSEARSAWGVSAKDECVYLPDFMTEKRTNVLYSNHTTDYDSLIEGLDVNTSIPLFEKLGATIMRGLSSKVTLNFSNGHNSAFISEGGNAVESSPTRATAVLDPRRVGGQEIFINEFLSVSKLMDQEFSDMLGSVDRALSKEMISQANLANINSAFEAADTAAFLTYANAVGLQSGLEIDDFKRPAYVMSAQVFHYAQGNEKVSGSGTYIVDQNIDRNIHTSGIGGQAAFGTTDLPIHDTNKYDVVWGDWSRAFIGMYEGLEILVDPYTGGTAGLTKFIFTRMADTVVNPAGFQSYRNIKIA